MGDLSKPSMGVTTTDTGTLIIQMNVYAHAITQQPQFPYVDVDGLRDINDQLATAQGHANAWLTDYSGQVWNRLQGLISFGETFENLYSSLYTYAENMADQNQFYPNQIDGLIASLQALQSLVRTQLDASQQTYEVISQYMTEVEADQSAFMTDYDTANTALGGDQGEIAQLQKKIAAEQAALNKDIAIIGLGAVAVVVGGLAVAVGALAEFETAGLSTVIVAGGILLIVGGVGSAGYGGYSYDQTANQLKADQEQLANDQAEVSMINGMLAQITNITTTLGNTVGALQNLVTAWQQIDNGISQTIADLQAPEQYLESLQQDDPSATPQTVSIILCAELETAQQDWESTIAIAESLMTAGRNIDWVNTGSELPTQAAIAQAANVPLEPSAHAA
ncbi:MAG: HBL/NHE enterotoxin family protein [Salinarimonas sp.]